MALRAGGVYASVMGLRVIREDEVESAARSASLAFATSFEDCMKWFEASGTQHLRVLERDDRARAFLMRIAMGQYVHGASMPMYGVAGVSVPPEHRGRGYGRELMREAVRAMFDEGFVLSTLYASTQTLYRSVGYEQSGSLFEHRVPRGEFAGMRAGDFDVRPLTVDDPLVRELYRRYAAMNNGYLDRGPYIWNRIANHRGTRFEVLGCFRPDQSLAAYASLVQAKEEGDDVVLKVRDAAFVDGFGARALLSLIDRFTTMSKDVLLLGGASLPLLSLLPQQKFDVHRIEYAMSRVIDVERALRARPYLGAGEVTLEVRDALIAQNNGAFTIESDGRGKSEVRRGGAASAARCALDVRLLAPLLSSYASASVLGALGELDASEDVRATLDRLFAGPAPSLCDFF